MTEKEAIRQLKYMYKTCMDEKCKHKGQCDLCCEARDMAIKALEEFKALKEKEERFDRNITMFNEIGLEIRANAIDEFTERVITQYRQLPTTLGYTEQIIREIAEQLKAGTDDQ